MESPDELTDYTHRLTSLLRVHANPEQAGPMQAYMRDQFEFLGIRAPERDAVVRQYLKENGVPKGEALQTVVRELWQQPEREYQYAALTLLEKYRKDAEPSHIGLLEKLVSSKSWWDTVDLLAGRLVGDLFARYPELIPGYIERWMASDSIWLNRTAILFQLHYKARTDTVLLFDLILRLSHSKEFFIQKAIGWALREYSKTDETLVRQFVADNTLAPLSVREALKYAERIRNNSVNEQS
ncbi:MULTISPECIES: DNA alkylation repair protein [unclassified Paenibacillus]|uniref:DNA alkylation repair protein n=1 Tax=unclassified Paenibacillus TaxID=185978 RepID=UPI001AE32366|nr:MULTISPECIES: DNA alkylation repair protein [unclassified Paenibacillus]MBP1156922.1 3-methyladenine DNA glycosylase AlkD [Paenibacillus sp. PvP091]MBP1172339.1 3-methyladenine DNA glycosylase AlkD [Paenibacillus sp. PvR098]MBP2438720.1 3-methyladenine DNA glycosylase AlkD [Paenibacillus sp. PvP052]